MSMSVDTSQRLGCLHGADGCLSTYSNSSAIKEVPSLHFQQSGLPIHRTTLNQIDGHNCCSSPSVCHLTFSVPRRLVQKRSYTRQTNISHNLLSQNCRINSKSKTVRYKISSVIHLYMDGISDSTKYSQSTTRSYGIPTLDNQTFSNSDSSFSSNFPFFFGETQGCSRLSSSKQTSFTSSPNVSVFSLETSYLVRLSLLTMTNPNQLCDMLLFVCSKMADETNLSSKRPVADRTREV